jgi:hypothetical protein
MFSVEVEIAQADTIMLQEGWNDDTYVNFLCPVYFAYSTKTEHAVTGSLEEPH